MTVPFDPGGMIGQILTGILLLLVGAVAARWPYRVARFSERVDLTGNTPSQGRPEPSDWNVGATRGAGLVAMFLGVVLLASTLVG